MAKKKKKHNGMTSFVGSLESTKEVKAAVKKFNFKRALLIALSTIAAFAVLEAVISLEAARGMSISIITIVYYVITTVLLLAIIFLNRGFSKSELTPEMLDEDTPPEDAKRICERVNRQKKIAKRLMLVLIPFVFAIFFDLIYLFYGDLLAKILSVLVPD